MKLYEHGEALEAIFAELEATGGELTEDLAKRLDEAEMAFDLKAQAVALKIREMEANGEVLGEEERRLRAKRVATEHAAADLKRYLLSWLQRTGREVVKAPLATVRVQLAPSAVTYSGDPSNLPEGWTHYKPAQTTFNAQEALRRIRAGEAPPEGVEWKRTPYVRIY